MKKLLLICSLVVMLIGVTAIIASAKGITGGVSFEGGFVAIPADLNTATALSFPTGANVPVSGAGTFDFSALIAGTKLTMPGFTFNPFSPTQVLWTTTLSGILYEFDMISSNILTQTGTTISLFGNGLAKITGFDNTPAIWNLTANSLSGTSSFSASTGVPVPEPGTLMLIGFGLVGLSGVARKFKSRLQG